MALDQDIDCTDEKCSMIRMVSLVSSSSECSNTMWYLPCRATVCARRANINSHLRLLARSKPSGSIQ
eukprot:6492742-Amphidinium_carterae.1